MKKGIATLVSLLILLAARSQVVTDSIKIENHYRVFSFNAPVGSSTDHQLIFILHGSGGTGKGMMKQASKLDQQAATEKIFLVYPDGYKNYWNECRKAATSTANTENISEQPFFDSMTQYFSRRYGTDSRQFFAIGVSGGGHMAYKLAMTMPGKCKAITAIIANLPDSANLDCTASGKALPVMIVNGTSDGTNPYNGGQMTVNGSSYGGVRSTDSTFAYWSHLANYTSKPAEEMLPDNDTTNNQSIVRYTLQQKGKPEIVLLKVIGGGHSLPLDMDVYVEAERFFKRQ